MERIVIKLGTGILTRGIGLVDTSRIAEISAQIFDLREQGIEPIVVSSGAIGMGMGKLQLKQRPQTLSKQQACAAIGQSRLIQCWQDSLRPHGLVAAQILLTHDDLRVRSRYVNAKATLEQLLSYKTVPIINENDSVSAYEIRFGNNDILGAMVASLLGAKRYFILSTIPGLMDLDGDGRVIPEVSAIDESVSALAKGTSSPTAVGGMVSKIEAARLAAEAGCETFIADGKQASIVSRIISGESLGTRFHPSAAPKTSKKLWLAYFQRPSGSISVDEGAAIAIVQKQRSLLPAGLTASEGHFESGDVVDVIDPKGNAIARGEVSYSRAEIQQILSQPESELASLFPQRNRLEAVHRDAMVLL